MPTTDTYTIDPVGGGATDPYSSYNALVADLQSQGAYGYEAGVQDFFDLVTFDKLVVVQIKSGAAVTGAFGLGSPFVQDATHYLTIRPYPGHRHQGVFSTTKAYFAQANPEDATASISGFAWFTHIEGMQFDFVVDPGVGTNVALSIPDVIVGPVYIDGCIFRLTSSGSTDAIGIDFGVSEVGGSVISNCLFYCSGSTGNNTVFIKGSFFAYDITVHNCTFINLSTSAGAGANMLVTGGNAGTEIATQNCYFGAPAGSGVDVYVSTSGGTFSKGANDATYNTEAATSSLREISIADCKFLDSTFATADFHLRNNSSRLARAGATLSGVTTDFESEARSAPYSIGADEL